MAVAILMMNMHGAVCASDHSMTILCYKDGVPFAVMVDPNSKLPWKGIFDKFRVKHPDLTENYVDTFKEYLKEELPEYRNLPQKDSLFCICYNKERLFPSADYLIIQAKGNSVKIEKDEENSCQISPNKNADINWLGDMSNMGLITGEMFAGAETVIYPIYQHLIGDFKSRILSAAGNDEERNFIEKFLSKINFSNKLSQVTKKFKEELITNLFYAISLNHIEDMVRMLESLVDAENQQYHLLHPKEPIGNTKEIATLTLVEGFKWLKFEGLVL